MKKLIVTLVIVGALSMAASAQANSISLGACNLYADNPTYSGGNAYAVSDICRGSSWTGLYESLQGCLQANHGSGWYNVTCSYVPKEYIGEIKMIKASTAPCGYWFREWSWGQDWYLIVTWQTHSGSVTSNANYRC